jgi:hypothetical protein
VNRPIGHMNGAIHRSHPGDQTNTMAEKTALLR